MYRKAYFIIILILALQLVVVISADAQLSGLMDRVPTKSDDSKKKDKKTDENAEAKAAPTVYPAYTGPKKRLGIEDLEVKVTASSTTTAAPTTTTTTTTVSIPMPTDFGTGLTEMLTTELMKTNRFILLERKAMADIAAEQALGASAAADPNAAIKPGDIKGAQYLIRGAITEYSYDQSSLGGTGSIASKLNLSSGTTTALVGLDIRIYDAATSEIIASEHARGTAKAKSKSADLEIGNVSLGGSSFSSTPLGQASREAIDNAVQIIVANMDKAATRPWEGGIADIETDGADTSLYINAGTDIGIKVGDVLEIWRAGHDIIDPQTNMSMGQRTKDHLLGRVTVQEVNATVSIAKPLDGQASEFKKGDLVKRPIAGN